MLDLQYKNDFRYRFRVRYWKEYQVVQIIFLQNDFLQRNIHYIQRSSRLLAGQNVQKSQLNFGWNPRGRFYSHNRRMCSNNYLVRGCQLSLVR